MEQPTIATKIMTLVETGLIKKLTSFIDKAGQGDLAGFEDQLTDFVRELYNLVAEEVLGASAQASQGALGQKARVLRLGKLEERPLLVQIRTGHYVTVTGLYAKKVAAGYQGPRHLLRAHWKLLKGASPAYYSQVCLLGVLCPSFEVACHILQTQGIGHNRERVRELSQALARHCKGRQAALSREAGESLRGKRVLIGIDGGRTRMRQYTGEKNAAGNAKFDTPWMEPKMFVIDRLDEKGNIERSELPLYGCMFGDEELVDLLVEHLQGLEIQHAKQVQIVADGAPWIWNRIKTRLLALGLPAKKIIETVDYYHACQYVYKIIELLPAKPASQAPAILKDFKRWLWEGNIDAIVKKCAQYFRRPSKEIKRYIAYLDKNKERMQYTLFRNNKLVCGSGIIESGIRRIINLRFKNASSFWKPENVEGLYFLRGTLLAYRWNIFINNLIRA